VFKVIKDAEKRKILLIYLSFWILPIIGVIATFLTNLFTTMTKDSFHYSITVNFYQIIKANLIVYILLILLGILNSKLPYVLFYYNSIIFTGMSIIFMETYGIKQCIVKILPHGILEILGLSIATYIGVNIRRHTYRKFTSFFFYGISLILIAATVESFEIYLTKIGFYL
jgi:uncharacterized membrane protein SpoIIM required for sporulation